MINITLGTTNKHKVKEITEIVSSTSINFVLCSTVDPTEDGQTYLDNAIIKAKAYAKETGRITLSEDCGLEVEALNNLPGIYSARFSECTLSVNLTSGKMDNNTLKVIDHVDSAKENVSDENNKLLLKLIGDDTNRNAKFVVAIAVSDPDGNILFTAQSETHGIIACSLKGSNGYCYDKLFIGHNTDGLTFAELDSESRHLHSYRHNVLQKFMNWYLQQPIETFR